MRQDPSYFDGKEPILIYIAKKLKDALKLERLFTEHGVDFGVEADRYHGGIIIRGQRVGAFFYVLPEAVETAGRVMRENGYKPYEGEQPKGETPALG